MVLTATSGGVPDDVFQTMKSLARLGYHVFPAAPFSKQPWPGLPWKAFEDTPITDDLIDKLARLPKAPNVALICNEHLVVIDIDNLTFGAWFEAQGPERLGTWIVQTPSGGLHVYVRSADPIATTVLKTSGGLKVGDLKARGGYVICPPSVGSNGEYETVYGAPNRLVQVDNAREWFNRSFIEPYAGTLPVRIDSVTQAGGDNYANVRVQDPPPLNEQQALAALLKTARLANRIHEYVYVTLTEGVDAAADHWKNPDDHSGVDFGCVKDLIDLGWTFQQIEQWYSFAPIGEPRYRAKEKSRGQGYLLRTYDNAKARWDADQIHLKNAKFANFEVVEPVERYTLDKEIHYAFKLQSTDRQPNVAYDVKLRGVDLALPQRFRDACYRSGVYIDLGNFDTKDKLRTFAEILDNLAVDVALPEMASPEGVLRVQIRRWVMLHASAQGAILDAKAWMDKGHVYARPAPLLDWLRVYMGGRFNPQDMWLAWRSLQGIETTYEGQPAWKAPLTSFPGLVS